MSKITTKIEGIVHKSSVLNRLFGFLRNNWARFAVSGLIISLIMSHVLSTKVLTPVELIERYTYDLRLTFDVEFREYLADFNSESLGQSTVQMEETGLVNPNSIIDNRIVIVDIDEHSIAKEGRFPWPRHKLAELTKQLFEHYEIFMMGYDITFAEQSENSGFTVLDKLNEQGYGQNDEFVYLSEQIRQELDYDYQFAKSMANNLVVLGYSFTETQKEQPVTKQNLLPPSEFSMAEIEGIAVHPYQFDSFTANFPLFVEYSTASGHFNVVPDVDGNIRRVSMLVEHEQELYQSLPLAMYRSMFANEPIELIPDILEKNVNDVPLLGGLKIGALTIPVDRKARVLIPFNGKDRSFKYVSAHNVMKKKVPIEDLKGKIIFVGTTAAGLQDLRSTPLSSNYPGVEIHATVLSNMLGHVRPEWRNSTFKSTKFARLFEATSLLLSGLLITLLMPIVKPLWSMVLSSLLLSGNIFIVSYVWYAYNLYWPIATIFICILLLLIYHISFNYFAESSRSNSLMRKFGEYIPPERVKQLDNDQYTAEMETKVAELTVLFVDIRDFTTLAESMKAKDLSSLVNAYLTPMSAVIHNYKGTIDKYIGDAIMAFWGEPIRDPDHAGHALEAVFSMYEELEILNQDFVDKFGWKELKIGMGLASGNVRVGDMGSEFRRAYTVMGNIVNLASRFEGLTKTYGLKVIVNKRTVELTPQYLHREIDIVQVKGKTEPEVIYEPMGLLSKMSKKTIAEVETLTHAQNAFRQQDWDQAETLFSELHDQNKEDSIYQYYLRTISEHREQPPPKNWDGVNVLNKKKI